MYKEVVMGTIIEFPKKNQPEFTEEWTWESAVDMQLTSLESDLIYLHEASYSQAELVGGFLEDHEARLAHLEKRIELQALLIKKILEKITY